MHHCLKVWRVDLVDPSVVEILCGPIFLCCNCRWCFLWRFPRKDAKDSRTTDCHKSAAHSMNHQFLRARADMLCVMRLDIHVSRCVLSRSDHNLMYSLRRATTSNHHRSGSRDQLWTRTYYAIGVAIRKYPLKSSYPYRWICYLFVVSFLWNCESQTATTVSGHSGHCSAIFTIKFRSCRNGFAIHSGMGRSGSIIVGSAPK